MESISKLLAELGVDMASCRGEDLHSRSPVDGSVLASLRADSPAEVRAKMKVHFVRQISEVIPLALMPK